MGVMYKALSESAKKNPDIDHFMLLPTRGISIRISLLFISITTLLALATAELSAVVSSLVNFSPFLSNILAN